MELNYLGGGVLLAGCGMKNPAKILPLNLSSKGQVQAIRPSRQCVAWMLTGVQLTQSAFDFRAPQVNQCAASTINADAAHEVTVSCNLQRQRRKRRASWRARRKTRSPSYFRYRTFRWRSVVPDGVPRTPVRLFETIASRTAFGDMPGWRARRRAAAPVTYGAEIDVPDI